MAASKDIGKLVVQLQMELEGLRSDVNKSNSIIKSATTSWQKDFKNAATGIKEVFAGSLLAGAVQGAVSSITSAITGMFDEFDRLTDTADKLNTTTTTLQELGFAASQVGVDAGTAEAAIQKLQVNLGKIGTGGGKAAAEAIEKLGLSVTELRTVDPGEALAKISEAFKTLPDQAARSAAAVALFGRSGAEIIPLIQQFNDLREQAHRLGIVINESTVRSAGDLADQMAVLKLQGQAFLAEVLKPLIPVLAETATSMIGTGAAAGKMGTGMAGASASAKTLGESLANLIRWSRAADATLNGALWISKGAGTAMRDFETGSKMVAEGVDHISDAWKGYKAETADDVKMWQERADKLREQAAEYRRLEQRMRDLGNVRREEQAAAAAAAAEEAAKASKKASDATAKKSAQAEKELARIREQERDDLQKLIDKENALRATRDQSIRDVADAQARVLGATQDQIDLQNAANDGYSKETVLNKQRAQSMNDVARELDQWAVFAKEAFDAQQGGANETKRAMDNLIAAYNTGRISLEEYNAAVRQVNEESKQLSAEQQAFADTLGTGLGEIFGAIITGAEDAEDAVKRLIIQLIALAAQQAAMKAINTAFAASANGNAFDTNGMVPFAQGGIVMGPTAFRFGGGRLGVMGEAGPEAILPLQRGPNGKLGVAGGGGVNVTVINNTGAQVGVNQDDPSNLRVTIDQMASALATQISKGGNPVSAALERTYGVRR